MDKYKQLQQQLGELGSLAIAFSGGVDSTFLLAAAKQVLGDRVLAVTIKAPFHLAWEIDEAIDLATEIGVHHEIIDLPGIPQEIKNNPADRCYLCKKIVFSTIKDFAAGSGIKYVADGSNADDTKDYRPGMRALKELGAISPLLDVGLTKAEIRDLSKKLNLPTWDKPAYACILSRIQYDQEITEQDLRRIEQAELWLARKGLSGVRVRLHGNLTRIEVSPESIPKIVQPDFRQELTSIFRQLGFKYITLDLEGYRMGSQNEVLNHA